MTSYLRTIRVSTCTYYFGITYFNIIPPAVYKVLYIAWFKVDCVFKTIVKRGVIKKNCPNFRHARRRHASLYLLQLLNK